MTLDRINDLIHHRDPTELRTTLCLLLAAVTMAVYCQVATHDFLNYDDQMFVYDNPHVSTGLSMANVRWAFTTLHGNASYWHPLTWISLQLDWTIFGQHPGGFHLTNVWMHLANTSLVLILLFEMTGRIWESALVAALFAVHPLHIETVAWISERKTLLCSFFWLLSGLAYVKYARQRSLLFYIVSLLFCAASLMSKPLAVTLPFTLLLIDFWPLGRCEVENKSAYSKLRTALVLVLEKLPFFAMSAAASLLTVQAQRDLGALSSLQETPVGARLQNAIIAYGAYLRKMVWPADLAPIYPLQTSWLWWKVAGSGILLFCITLLSLRCARTKSHLLFGWLWYLGTLFPTIGLIQAGSQALADRYSYVSFIGLFVAIVWTGAELVQTFPSTKRFWGTASVIVCLLLGSATAWQVSYWKNSIRLFEHAARVTAPNALACLNLGLAFHVRGNLPENEEYLRECIRLRPGLEMAHMSLAGALFQKGDLEQALHEHNLAMQMKADDPENHGSLANLYANSPDPRFRKPDKALEHARRACKITQYRQRRFLILLAGTSLISQNFQEALDAAHRAMSLSITPTEIQEAKGLLLKVQEMIVDERSGNRTE
jgi:hypothetical protein